jgi:hypothetical protein
LRTALCGTAVVVLETVVEFVAAVVVIGLAFLGRTTLDWLLAFPVSTDGIVACEVGVWPVFALHSFGSWKSELKEDDLLGRSLAS